MIVAEQGLIICYYTFNIDIDYNIVNLKKKKYNIEIHQVEQLLEETGVCMCNFIINSTIFLFHFLRFAYFQLFSLFALKENIKSQS
jgi:hypothetical protein